MTRDDLSSVTVRLDSEASKPLSQAKVDQLARARVKSLEVRRRKSAEKLQGKLNAIRSMLGNDLRADTVERVAREMAAREDRHAAELGRLREKQTVATEELTGALTSVRDELQRMRKAIPGRSSAMSATSAPRVVKTLSEVGSQVSSAGRR